MKARGIESVCVVIGSDRETYHLGIEAARPRDAKASCWKVVVAAELVIVTVRSWRSRVTLKPSLRSTSQGPSSLSVR